MRDVILYGSDDDEITMRYDDGVQQFVPERLCPGVPPGGGRIVRCLKAHKMEMSVGCAMTLRRIKARMAG